MITQKKIKCKYICKNGTKEIDTININQDVSLINTTIEIRIIKIINKRGEEEIKMKKERKVKV